MSTLTADITIVGGGLSGLLAAMRIGRQKKKRVFLVDHSLSNANGKLGGFARFSGAKFSLPPAGMGLAPVLGGSDALNETIASVLSFLDLDSPARTKSLDVLSSDGEKLDNATSGRIYPSIVLSPKEMEDLLDDLTKRMPSTVSILHGTCCQITRYRESWKSKVRLVTTNDLLSLASNTVVFAGGRTATSLLRNSGAKPTPGKGIDLGVRIEFSDPTALRELSRLGPDAKILHGNCRTFCLNVPGRIFRYPFGNLSIPGGIVANKRTSSSNVGILCRCSNREHWVRQIAEATKRFPIENLHTPFEVSNGAFGKVFNLISSVYGEDTAASLANFACILANLGLVDWTQPHYVHLPLLEWYWDTFSQPDTFETSLPGVYAIGDSSGHARGLLQAAVSGWAVAECLTR